MLCRKNLCVNALLKRKNSTDTVCGYSRFDNHATHTLKGKCANTPAYTHTQNKCAITYKRPYINVCHESSCVRTYQRLLLINQFSFVIPVFICVDNRHGISSKFYKWNVINVSIERLFTIQLLLQFFYIKLTIVRLKGTQGY